MESHLETVHEGEWVSVGMREEDDTVAKNAAKEQNGEPVNRLFHRLIHHSPRIAYHGKACSRR